MSGTSSRVPETAGPAPTLAEKYLSNRSRGIVYRGHPLGFDRAVAIACLEVPHGWMRAGCPSTARSSACSAMLIWLGDFVHERFGASATFTIERMNRAVTSIRIGAA